MESGSPATAYFERKRPGWLTAHVFNRIVERWKAEVGVFFDGVRPDSPGEELRRAAPKHPVFKLRSRGS